MCGELLFSLCCHENYPACWYNPYADFDVCQLIVRKRCLLCINMAFSALESVMSNRRVWESLLLLSLFVLFHFKMCISRYIVTENQHNQTPSVGIQYRIFMSISDFSAVFLKWKPTSSFHIYSTVFLGLFWNGCRPSLIFSSSLRTSVPPFAPFLSLYNSLLCYVSFIFFFQTQSR